MIIPNDTLETQKYYEEVSICNEETPQSCYIVF